MITDMILPRRFTIIVIFNLLLTGCGFHLRGQSDLPFNSVYIIAEEGSPLATELKRMLRFTSGTRIQNSPKDADAVLEITEETRDKVILSLSGGGRVREYELRYRARFRVHDNANKDLLTPGEITLRRDFTYNDAQVLAKEAEESLLFRDMERDAAQQILRRLNSARPS